jgi:hypothetical protein
VPKRLLAAATAALGLAASTVVASAGPAAADDMPCTINGITPTSVVVGISPVTRRFGVRTSDCSSVQGWGVIVGNYEYIPNDTSPYETFQYLSNKDAGYKSVSVRAYNGDYSETERSWARGFRLLRNTGWQGKSFNASPEPVRKGKPVTLKGRLLVANWDTGHYQAARVVSVKVQFRTPKGSYRTVKSGVHTSSTGWVSTKVTARQTGVWRLVYGGNTIAGPATTTGDAVKVK